MYTLFEEEKAVVFGNARYMPKLLIDVRVFLLETYSPGRWLNADTKRGLSRVLRLASMYLTGPAPPPSFDQFVFLASLISAQQAARPASAKAALISGLHEIMV
jgi:hypothetical protein